MTEQVGANAGPENANPQVTESVAQTTQEPKETVTETTEKTEVKETAQETVKEPKRNGFTRKIEKLERTIAELQQKLPNPQQPVAEAAPKPEDFENWGEFYAAQARFEAKQTFKQEQEAERARQKEQSLREERERTLSEFQRKAREFAKTVPNYDDVIGGLDIDLSLTLQQAVIETQDPALAYHLAQNPDLVEEINTKSYGEIARTLGRLQAKLEAPKAEVKTTKAPPPISPVGSRSAGSYDPYMTKGDDDFEAYQRWRQTQT